MFQDLPLELRLLVWTLALPAPRHIVPLSPSERTAARTKGTETYQNQDENQNPVILQVNHESRCVALQHYQTWRCMSPKLKHQYIDFKSDIIVFDHHDFVPSSRGNSPATALQKLSGADFRAIQQLELRLHQSTNIAWDDRDVTVPLSTWISQWLSGPLAGLKQLHVLVVVGHVNHKPRKCYLDTKLKGFVGTVQARGEAAMGNVAASKAGEGVVWTAPSLSVRGVVELENPGRWNRICLF